MPANFGTSPAQFTMNMRMSKTIGIGPKIESPLQIRSNRMGTGSGASHGGEGQAEAPVEGRGAWAARAEAALFGGALKDRIGVIASPSALTRATCLTTLIRLRPSVI